jgi:hypothetical protein
VVSAYFVAEARRATRELSEIILQRQTACEMAELIYVCIEAESASATAC